MRPRPISEEAHTATTKKKMADTTTTRSLRALRHQNAPEVARLSAVIVQTAEALAELERRMEAEAKAIAGKAFETEFKVSFQPDAMLYESLEWYGTVDNLRFTEVANFMDKVYRVANAEAAATEPPPLPFEPA